MLLVPTYVARSAIHGMGVFAAEAIPAGTTLWEFTPGVDWKIQPEVLESFPEPFLTELRHWCYLDESGVYVLCGDNAKFMNHSPAPNCDDTSGRRTVAGRDIEADEELTCDYRAFDVPSARRGVPEFEAAGHDAAVGADAGAGA